MPSIDKSVDVEVPVFTAYACWTDFEAFPRFMQGVESVQKTDPSTLHWKAKVFGKNEEWDAEIVEEIPDVRIAWRSVNGPYNAGVVNFQPLDENKTRVDCQLTYEPQGVMESIGDALGFLDRQVESDLGRFKDYVENSAATTTPPNFRSAA